MTDELEDLILYETIRNDLDFKQGLNYALACVSSIGFNLSYVDQINNFKYKNYNEAFFILAVKNCIEYGESFKYNLELYKEKAIKRMDNNFEDSNRNIYSILDDEDREVIDKLLLDIYDDIDVGIRNDFYLFSYMKSIYEYINRLKVIFDDDFINRTSNIKMFSLGLYTDSDYELVISYCKELEDKLKDKYDLSNYNLYREIKFIDIHDLYCKIDIESNVIKISNGYETVILNNAKVINYDSIKDKFSSIRDGYTYYIFKYNSGNYLGVFDFNGIDEDILIEFESSKVVDY